MLDFYKHITETVHNYLMFLVFVTVIYLIFCLTATYVTDLMIKVILAIRAPMPPVTVKVKSVENKE